MYQPLHHKYRPRLLSEVVGQPVIVTLVSRIIEEKRFHPAYLFAGARGTGKTSLARILTRSANCAQGPTLTPCLTCEQCVSIQNGSCPDVIEINAANHTGVDQIRDLLEGLAYAPSSCRQRFYILDEVHQLSDAAANALLKTLEEPPPETSFILATTDPEKLLKTVRSRCLSFDFHSLASSVVQEQLVSICQQENWSVEADVLFYIAEMCQGSMRDAQEMLDQVSLLDDPITLDRCGQLLGYVRQETLAALVKASVQQERQEIQTLLQSLLIYAEPLAVLQAMAFFVKDLLVLQRTDRLDLTRLLPRLKAEMLFLASTLKFGQMLKVLEVLQQNERKLKEVSQAPLWLELMLSEAFAGCTKNSPVPLAAALPAVAPKPTPPIAKTTPPLLDAEQLWPQVLSRLPPLALALFRDHGKLMAVTDQEAIVRLRNQGLLKAAEKHVATLQKIMSTLLGSSLKVSIIAGEQKDNAL